MIKVEQYFKDYPASKQCFETADGLIFHGEADAKNHGVVIKDNEVTHHKRPAPKKAVEKETGEATPPAPPAEKAKAVSAKKEAAAPPTDVKPDGAQLQGAKL